MHTRTTLTNRGRPRTITRERLTDAAVALGLPNVSVTAIAAELGVSAKGLYKHFAGPDELKQFVAEEIFLRWQLPVMPGRKDATLETYLLVFCDSMWDLVEKHPGIAPYMLRRDKVTPAMTAKMHAHQEGLANTFGLSFGQANWLLFTVAYYCVAVADTVLPLASDGAPASADPMASCDEPTDNEYATQVRTLYSLGSRALVKGSLATFGDITISAHK